MILLNNTLKLATDFIVPILLPILFGVLPTLYHYSNNVEKLLVADLARMMVFDILLAFIFYLFILAFNGFQAKRTAISHRFNSANPAIILHNNMKIMPGSVAAKQTSLMSSSKETVQKDLI